MKLYSVRVRLNGSAQNEVTKYNATAAELKVLAAIHNGGDNYPLAEVKETGKVNRSDARERKRLHDEYHEYNLGQGVKLLASVLPDSVPLPQEWVPPQFVPEDDEEEDILDVPQEDEVIEERKALTVHKDKPVRTKITQPVQPIGI